MKVKKKNVAVSILAISMICALSITIAYAKVGGTAKWRPLGASNGWTVIPPSPNHLDLDPDTDLPIEIMICDIPEEFFPNSQDSFKVLYKVSNENVWRGPVEISFGECIGPFEWPISPYTICKTNVVQYALANEKPSNGYTPGTNWNCGVIIEEKEKPSHLHVIPEFAFGTAMSLLPLLSSLGIYVKFRKK